MIVFLISLFFLLGDVCLQAFSNLPSKSVMICAAFISLTTWFIARKYFKYAYVLLAFAAGFLWAAWYAAGILSWSLPHESEGKPLLLRGVVASLPVPNTFGHQFEFRLQDSGALIRLTADEKFALRVGDEWQLVAKLKRIHGTQNPGAFDFEAWAIQKGLRATGWVVDDVQNQRLGRSWYPLQSLRQLLQEKINTALPTARSLPWIRALTIGERSGATAEDWQILRNTGTNHLMVVGGLHIGLIAGFFHGLVSFCWRRVGSLCLWLPAQQASACAALIAGLFYGALSGYLIPTQRACIMLTVFVFSILLKRQMNAWHSWSIAMLIVLLINPLCVLTESFCLSFVTIALIIYGMGHRLAPTGWWWKWGRVQWVIGVGLMPVTAMIFQDCSLISFLANSIAIPWLACLVLPFCLLGSLLLLVSANAGYLVLWVADKTLGGLWKLLAWFAQFHFTSFHVAMPSVFVFMLVFAGIILLLLPQGMPGRWLGIVWIASVFTVRPALPPSNHFWFTLLDVGQGLSAVIQTQHHVLVYDTGPKFKNGIDMGEAVVAPFLRVKQIKKIDKLVISHADNDHAGGMQALLDSFTVASLKTSDVSLAKRAALCHAGQSWQWDGVTFTFLSPTSDLFGRKIKHARNNLSCVLHVSNGKQSVLLPGDIEIDAEKQLLQAGSHLKSDIIVAPHHGSNTSGMKDFITAVDPRVVLFATGYRNRYHLPHPAVMQTYEEAHVQIFNSAFSGAIQFKSNHAEYAMKPTQYRLVARRYWFE